MLTMCLIFHLYLIGLGETIFCACFLDQVVYTVQNLLAGHVRMLVTITSLIENLLTVLAKCFVYMWQYCIQVALVSCCATFISFMHILLSVSNSKRTNRFVNMIGNFLGDHWSEQL